MSILPLEQSPDEKSGLFIEVSGWLLQVYISQVGSESSHLHIDIKAHMYVCRDINM